MKRTEGYFRGKSNFELFFQGWISEKPLATLVVTHGLGEHSDCYLRLIEGLQKYLAPQELNIYCWDLRGHGRSDGKRGVIKDFSCFSEDLQLFLSFLKKEDPLEKLFLLSHSLGGLITLNTLIEHSDITPDGVIFSSPLLGVSVDVPSIKKLGARYLAEFLPNMTMWNEIPNKHLTHEKSIIDEFEKDPLRHDRISASLYLELLKYTEKIQKLGHRISIPTLFQFSKNDLVVSPSAIQEFFQTIKSADKKLTAYKDSHHEIYNDIERESAFQEIANWLKPRLES